MLIFFLFFNSVANIDTKEKFMNLSIEEIYKIIPEGNNKQKFITLFNTISKYPDFDEIQSNITFLIPQMLLTF